MKRLSEALNALEAEIYARCEVCQETYIDDVPLENVRITQTLCPNCGRFALSRGISNKDLLLCKDDRKIREIRYTDMPFKEFYKKIASYFKEKELILDSKYTGTIDVLSSAGHLFTIRHFGRGGVEFEIMYPHSWIDVFVNRMILDMENDRL